MVLQRLVVPPLDANCYVVSCEASRIAGVIDPGGDPQRIAAVLAERELALKAVLLTHSHFDHTTAAADLCERTGASVYAHPAEHEQLLRPDPALAVWLGVEVAGVRAVEPLSDGAVVALGSVALKALATPGHSPGGVCFLTDHAVFTGDTLLAGGVGRTDLPGGDHEQLMHSLHERLLVLPPETRVYPGHGPPSTIGRELRDNPWLAAG